MAKPLAVLVLFDVWAESVVVGLIWRDAANAAPDIIAATATVTSMENVRFKQRIKIP